MKISKSVTIARNAKGERTFVPTGASSFVARESVAPTTEKVRPVIGMRSEMRNEPVAHEVADAVLRPKAPEPLKDTRAMEVAAMEIADITGGAPQETSVSAVSSNAMLMDTLEGDVPTSMPGQPNMTITRLYRDCYYNDATSGAAIELRATLPFSEFTLAGLRDEKMLEIFVSSIESMNMQALLPALSTDYDVVGSFTASMTWDENKKRYNGIMPHNVDDLIFLQVPAFGIDPIIEYKMPASVKAAFKSDAIRERYKEFIPADIMARVTGQVENKELNRKHTIFIPRSSLLQDFAGMSYLRRVLPAWLYEKALIRGTRDQVYKRQRATTHITVAETEDWIAEQDEMTAIANLFMSADMDPLGAVVVTRAGVTVNEVRRGDDFWRWDQNYDAIEKIKLRALAISEAIVTAEANFNTMEQALSVFLEGIRDYRARITREIFYDKMFPMIAHANGITKRRYARDQLRSREVARYGETHIGYDENNELYARIGSTFPELAKPGNALENINPSDYVIPRVQWDKRLLPEGDNDYLTMLGTMQEMGLPIPIRALAAAGGQNIDTIINGMEEDKSIREKIAEYRKAVAEINKDLQGAAEGMGGMPGEEGEGGDDMGEIANVIARNKFDIGSVRRVPIGARGNPDSREAEFAAYDSQGHRRVMTKQGRDMIANKFNKNMSAALGEVARQENARARSERIEPAVKTYYKKD